MFAWRIHVDHLFAFVMRPSDCSIVETTARVSDQDSVGI